MSWIFLGILSHIFWGTANILDKYIVSNRIKNVYVFFLITTIIGLLSLLLIPFIEFKLPSWETMQWILLAGLSYTLGIIAYFKALEIEEVSRINVWWNLIPVFTLVLAWLTIGETLTSSQLFAMMMLLGGAVLASLHFGQKRIIQAKALGYIAFACSASAIYAVIIRNISDIVSLPVLFILISVIKFIISLVFFLSRSFCRDFRIALQDMKLPLYSVVIVATVIDYLGIWFNQWALSRGPAALVFSLEGFQALFVFFVSLILTKFWPNLLQEKIDVKNLTIKCAAVICMIFGILLLAQ